MTGLTFSVQRGMRVQGLRGLEHFLATVVAVGFAVCTRTPVLSSVGVALI